MTDAVLRSCRPPTGSACDPALFQIGPSRYALPLRRCLTPGQRRASSVGRGRAAACHLLEVLHEGGRSIVPGVVDGSSRHLSLPGAARPTASSSSCPLPRRSCAAWPLRWRVDVTSTPCLKLKRGSTSSPFGCRRSGSGAVAGRLSVWHRAHRQARARARRQPGAADGVCGPGAGGRVAGGRTEAVGAAWLPLDSGRAATGLVIGRQPAPVAGCQPAPVAAISPLPAMAASPAVVRSSWPLPVRRLPWPPAVARHGCQPSPDSVASPSRAVSGGRSCGIPIHNY